MKADSDEEEEGPGLVARVKTYFQTRSPSFYIRLCAWLGLYYYFIQVEFGLVYFIVSAILFMFLNTSATGSDPEGSRGNCGVAASCFSSFLCHLCPAPSAYSVFNQDGTTLPGTFSTKSLENAIGLPKYGD